MRNLQPAGKTTPLISFLLVGGKDTFLPSPLSHFLDFGLSSRLSLNPREGYVWRVQPLENEKYWTF